MNITGFNTQIGSITGGGTTGGGVTLGAATLTVGGDNTSPGAYAGSITGTGALNKIGTGTLTLTGSNLYSGGTTFANGVINVGSVGALNSTGNLVFTGGTLQYSSANTLDYSSRLVSSSSAITIDTNGQNVTYGSAIAASNSGGLTKLGAGTLLLKGTDAYTGATTVNAGTLATNNANGVSSGTVDLNNASTLQFTASGFTFANNVVLGSGGGIMNEIFGSGAITLTGTYTGGTGLTFSPPVGGSGLGGAFFIGTTTTDNLGTLNLIGNGTALSTQNRLIFNNSAALGFIGNNATVNVSNDYVFDFQASGTLTNAINFGDGTALEARANETLSLTNATLPTSGMITIGADDTASNNSFTLSNSSGTLTTLVGDLTVSTNPYSGAGSGTQVIAFNSAIAGSGGLVLTGPGTNTLTDSGVNTYSGATTVNGGTLILTGNDSGIGSGEQCDQCSRPVRCNWRPAAASPQPPPLPWAPERPAAFWSLVMVPATSTRPSPA